MPCSHVVDVERRRVTRTWTGIVDFDDLVAALHALLADPLFDPAFDVLADYRDADVQLSIEDLRRFRAVLDEHDAHPTGRLVMILPGDLDRPGPAGPESVRVGHVRPDARSRRGSARGRPRGALNQFPG